MVKNFFLKKIYGCKALFQRIAAVKSVLESQAMRSSHVRNSAWGWGVWGPSKHPLRAPVRALCTPQIFLKKLIFFYFGKFYYACQQCAIPVNIVALIDGAVSPSRRASYFLLGRWGWAPGGQDVIIKPAWSVGMSSRRPRNYYFIH